MAYKDAGRRHHRERNCCQRRRDGGRARVLGDDGRRAGRRVPGADRQDSYDRREAQLRRAFAERVERRQLRN